MSFDLRYEYDKKDWPQICVLKKIYKSWFNKADTQAILPTYGHTQKLVILAKFYGVIVNEDFLSVLFFLAPTLLSYEIFIRHLPT